MDTHHITDCPTAGDPKANASVQFVVCDGTFASVRVSWFARWAGGTIVACPRAYETLPLPFGKALKPETIIYDKPFKWPKQS
ncbi:hypothetical protein EV130_102243 [Rhizobium azibense]|uniref:Uncharacterized protein n=1 Tax=Rhizobium azibense TaxID=1136135 RepID=A0A4R3RRQ4_9HYPH|nr:hypothetical protein EV130_102243 [Rhizobium azibense]TCU37704.1 hypothetical protein EV129_10520 [Rhizobium azibense]